MNFYQVGLLIVAYVVFAAVMFAEFLACYQNDHQRDSHPEIVWFIVLGSMFWPITICWAIWARIEKILLRK